jgi:hypothetical protein
MTEAVEHLLCKYEVLSSNPSPTKKHKVHFFSTEDSWPLSLTLGREPRQAVDGEALKGDTDREQRS